MNDRDLNGEDWNIGDLLRSRFEGRESCADVIESFEVLMSSIWDYLSRFLTVRGTRAIVEHSAKLAGRKAPMVNRLRIGDEGIDFGDLLVFVEQEGCDRPQVVNALLRLSARVFWVLEDLTGDALRGPLLQHLRGDDRSENGICGFSKSNGHDA
ncbi:MAG: hypothetical protein M1358_24270 [Chloroflexi bacterium]|nr:hypothetical protein [Chloroflexota bacterium]